MQSNNKNVRCFQSVRKAVVAISAIGFLSYSAGSALAAVFAVGDVSPQQTFTNVNIGGQLVEITAPDVPTGGGRVEVSDGMMGTMDADLVVGGTGLFSGNVTLGIGTTIGEITINNPSGTLPLIAENIFIGMESNGRGRINLNDFGTTLVAEDELIIGEEGEGELKLTNGARVGVGIFNVDPNVLAYENGETILGQMRQASGANQFLSQGLISIDGFGTIFETVDLTIADEGRGTVEISGKGKLLTEDTKLGLSSEGVGRLTLTGQGTQWTNTDDLIVGDNGTGLIEVDDFAVLLSDTITVGTTSFVDLKGGTVISNSTIDNNGIVRGYGRIESDLSISASGELRNYGVTGVANPSESLLVTGAVANGGTIESNGGEMEFQSVVTNSLEIIARDTTIHFRAGLTNNGTLSIGGNTEIHGNVTNTGSIFVLSDSESILVGDLIFTGSGILGLTVGEETGTLDVTGAADLTSAILSLDYSAGIASQPGDTYQIFQADGGITGLFPTVAAADGRIWDISLVGTDTLIATAGGAAIPFGADFNGDGIVNLLDLTIWRNNFGTTGAMGSLGSIGDADGDGDVDGSDFFRIQGDLGGPPTFLAVVGAVPEPSTLALALLTMVCCPRRHRRS